MSRHIMNLPRLACATTGTVLALLLAANDAEAAGLNDKNCKPTANRPFPVIVVHGQAGNFEGMRGVTDALVREGYCVFARNYGFVPGGANGQDHLSSSANQISQQLDEVLALTKAQKVDVVGHSAGTGVLDNMILKKKRADKVHNFVSFGGLHHPYAHAGLAGQVDASVYLPNLTLVARKVVPGFKIIDVIKVGTRALNLDPALRATAESPFVEDLFDPDYWQDLHGGHSELNGDLVKVGDSERTKLTNDAAPNICYTNIVAIADLLVGPATGFLDEAANVDNFLLTSTITQNAHNDMLGDPIAIGKMLSGLTRTCEPGGNKRPPTLRPEAHGGSGDPDATDAFTTAVAEEEEEQRRSRRRSASQVYSEGCSLAAPHDTGSSAWLAGFAVGAMVVAARVRERRLARSNEARASSTTTASSDVRSGRGPMPSRCCRASSP